MLGVGGGGAGREGGGYTGGYQQPGDGARFLVHDGRAVLAVPLVLSYCTPANTMQFVGSLVFRMQIMTYTY